jgi:hypothetical protein
VRFLRSFPGRMVMDQNVAAYSEGTVAGFAPVVAKELIRAGYVEYAKNAA